MGWGHWSQMASLGILVPTSCDVGKLFFALVALSVQFGGNENSHKTV